MGQHKGATFEREICRELSLWWTKGEMDDVFWRNRTRITGKAYNAQMQEGDIVAVKSIGTIVSDTLCIECKTGYSLKKPVIKKTKSQRVGIKERVKNIPWDLLDMLDGQMYKLENATIIKFWEQTKKAAELAEKIPVLIFKRDFHVPVIVVNDDFLALFPLEINEKIKAFDILGDNLSFYRLETFLAALNPEMMIKGMESIKCCKK